MTLSEIICCEACLTDLQERDRDSAIKALMVSLDKAGRLKRGTVKQITQALIDRENEASTGMGKGVAVPHVKHVSVKEVTGAIGISAEGIDFLALDKQPVFSIILLLSPLGNTDKHLRAMERIFNHLQYERFRSFLRQCRTTDHIRELLKEADEDPSW